MYNDILIFAMILVFILLLAFITGKYPKEKVIDYTYKEKNVYHETIFFEDCFAYKNGYMLCK